MRSVLVWEAIFMLVVLKIPMAYLAAVVVWAIRAEPAPGGGSDHARPAFVPLSPCGWDDWKRTRARRPSSSRPFDRRRRPTPRPRLGATA